MSWEFSLWFVTAMPVNAWMWVRMCRPRHRIFFELRPFVPALAVTAYFVGGLEVPAETMHARIILLVVHLAFWWLTRNEKDDDDRWRRRRKAAADRIELAFAPGHRADSEALLSC